MVVFELRNSVNKKVVIRNPNEIYYVDIGNDISNLQYWRSTIRHNNDEQNYSLIASEKSLQLYDGKYQRSLWIVNPDYILSN